MAVGLAAKQIGLQLEIEVRLEHGRQGIDRQLGDHGCKRFRFGPSLKLRQLGGGMVARSETRRQQRIGAGGQAPGAQQAMGMLQPQQLLITLQNRFRIELSGSEQLIRRGVENQRFRGQRFTVLAALPATTLQPLLQRWFQMERREPERHCEDLLLWLKLGPSAAHRWHG